MNTSLWKQGEHVAIIGDTGSGKTFLENRILSTIPHVIVLKTKDDETRFTDFVTRTSVHSLRASDTRVVLKPKYERQAVECYLALEKVWREGGWTVAIDELFYAIDELGLKRPINKLLTQGRSKYISVIAGMQRPVGVTRYAVSQATHVFAFETEGRDVKTIAEATTPRVMPLFEQLERYQFIYFNRRTRQIAIARAQKLDSIGFGEAA